MAEITLATKIIKRETLPIKTTGFLVPANATGTAEITINLDPVEVLDTTRSFWFHIYEFVNNEWRHIAGAKWVGGGNNDPDKLDDNPRFWFDISRVAGKTIKLDVDITRSQKIGYTIKIIS